MSEDAHAKAAPPAPDHPPAPGDEPLERLLEEVNLLRLEGLLFCFDPRQAKRRRGPLDLGTILGHPVTVEPHPHYGQPSAVAYKILQAIFFKLTDEGFPVPDTVSFSQRELARLIGRKSFGGANSLELYQALMQLRSTLIHCARYNKESDAWVAGNFQVLTTALFSGRRKRLDACMVKIDDGIVDSLNRGYFTSVNWAVLQTLEPIGMVLYKRLVFTFAHLLSTGTSPKDLQLEKDYGALCRDWLGGLKPERYRSKILSNQLGRHLGDLRQAGVIRRCEVEKRADASGFKLVFLPGRRFFADHEALTAAPWQPRLRFRQSADDRVIGQPLRLVAYFHRLCGHGHSEFEPEEVACASALLERFAYEDVRALIEFTVRAARRSGFEAALFQAVRQHVEPWIRHGGGPAARHGGRPRQLADLTPRHRSLP
jgi:hypothetical protein